MAGDQLSFKGDWIVNVSRNFLFKCNLSLQARFIFAVLKAFANPNHSVVFPSIKTLAKICDLNRETVCKYLNELIGKGYVSKTQSRNMGGEFAHNLYTLIEENCDGTSNTATGKSGYGNSGTKKSQSINRFLPDSIEVRLSELLFTFLKKKNPKHKQPNIQTWAKHIDLMIRKDNRTPEEIEQMIVFAQAHPFWFKNIESTQKLRVKFDRLILEEQSSKSRGYMDIESDDCTTNGDDSSFIKKLLEESKKENDGH